MNVPDFEYIKEKIFSRSTRGFLKKEFPDFVKYLDNNYDNVLSFSEKLYWFYNKLVKRPVCKTCGGFVNYNGLIKGYRDFCSLKCSRNNNDTIQKLKQTNIEKYGVEWNSQSESSKYKMKQTNIEKYGCSCTLHNTDISKKVRQTKLERYGDETFTNPQKTKQTKLERYGDENYQNREQIKKTCLNKYGGISPFHNKNVQEHSHKTKISNFVKHNDWLLDSFYEDGKLIYICKCDNNECNKCSEKTFIIPSQIYDTRRYNNICLCTKLLPIQDICNKGTSLEVFVRNILDYYNIYYKTNVKGIINKKEIDIYIPSKNIAIECNGIYWHSKKDKKYHYNKFNDCKSKNIQLLTLWEDWIRTKPEIIKSILLAKLGIYNVKIYARKCLIKEVSPKETKQFLENNHLQGNINSSIRLGLYYNDELVSLMTFGKLRKSLGNNSKNNVYELYRFCNKLNTLIIGGASKLFNYFIKHYDPISIESFSSNDISNGDLYKILGFEQYKEFNESYWFINNKNVRYHRYKFRKSELIKMGYDNSIEYDQFINNLGYFKIYDTGQSKWIYKKKDLI